MAGQHCMELLNMATRPCLNCCCNKHGADVRAQNHDGNTALHLAAAHGHQTIGQLLLRHGADVTAQNHDGNTALHTAEQNGHQAMVQLLLEHGAAFEHCTALCSWLFPPACGACC